MADNENDSEAKYQPDLEVFEDVEIDSQFILDTLELWKELLDKLEEAIEYCKIFDQVMGRGKPLENRNEYRMKMTTPFYIYSKNQL